MQDGDLPPQQPDPTACTALRARMREDFRLALMLLIGGTGVLVVSIFAVYRWHTGNVTGTLLNLAIVGSVGAVLALAARGDRRGIAPALFVLVATVASIFSAYVFGRTGIYWTFLVLWISFVLAPAWLALACNLALLAAVLVGNRALFDTGHEWAAYFATGFMVTSYAWLVSHRLERQRARLQVQAEADPLTGAGNRRLMQRELDRVLRATAPTDSGGVLAVLDLDHFKQVNDAHGHEAGDRVLVRLVALLEQRLRKLDGVFRLGGEEFVLLLPGTTLAQATPRLFALQAELNRGLAGLPGAVTVSIGAAEHQPGEGWSQWLGRADAALYRAKQAGRNRVVLSGGPAPADDAERRREGS
jgi:diguanylate cyclase (GGDEF)-like protein